MRVIHLTLIELWFHFVLYSNFKELFKFSEFYVTRVWLSKNVEFIFGINKFHSTSIY